MSIIAFWIRWYMSYFSSLIGLISIVLHFQKSSAVIVGVGAGAGIKTDTKIAPPSRLATNILA